MERRNFLKNSIISAGVLSSPLMISDLIADNKQENTIQPINDKFTKVIGIFGGG